MRMIETTRLNKTKDKQIYGNLVKLDGENRGEIWKISIF